MRAEGIRLLPNSKVVHGLQERKNCSCVPNFEPIENFPADIKRRKSCFTVMLAQHKAEEGMQTQGAALLRPWRGVRT